jgi:hypothetical protein
MHRQPLTAAAVWLATLACGVETVELRSTPIVVVEGSGDGADPPAAGMAVPPEQAVAEPPEQAVSSSNSPETPVDPPEMPDVGFYQPLPDGGVDLSPPSPVPGCRAIDFLFVVDNSLSMTDEQDNLVQSFGGFMQVVQSKLDAQDYHIMAVDTDDRGIGPGGLFDGPFVSPSSCNGVFGAGRNQSASGLDCGVEGGGTFMTATQTNLTETFACSARVGTFGDVLEQPMTALLSAVSPALNQAGGCNAGFLRDDAILVATFITDEDDTLSPDGPAVWHQRLVEAKGGDESAVVVLGLVGDSNLITPLEGGPCVLPDAAPAPRLQQFVEGLQHGSLGSVCASDYSLFLARAVDEIKDSCDTFTPPPR